MKHYTKISWKKTQRTEFLPVFSLAHFHCLLFLFMFRCVATGWFSKAPGLRPLAQTPTDDGGLKGRIPASLSSHREWDSAKGRGIWFLDFINKLLGEIRIMFSLQVRSAEKCLQTPVHWINVFKNISSCENITLLKQPRSLRPRVIFWSQKLKMPGGYYN